MLTDDDLDAIRHDAEIMARFPHIPRPVTSCVRRLAEQALLLVDEVVRLRAQLKVGELELEIDRLKAVIGRGVEQFHGMTWTHDIPKDPAGLEQCVERLRRTDGTHADAAVIVWEQCQALVREIDQLRAKEAESNG